MEKKERQAPTNNCKIKVENERDEILRQRKVMKGTDIFISEDLTRLNQQVLACIRKKLPDEVDEA